MARRFFQIILWMLTACVVFTTLAPLTPSNEWWVRGWDFPRIHIAGLCIAGILLGAAVFNRVTAIALVVLALAAGFQIVRIFPYTQWASIEVPFEQGVPDDARVSLISLNVLMENTDHAAVIDMIDREQPDVLFLMETDQTWVDALAPVLQTYATVVRHPLDNHYGLVFATNLTAKATEVVAFADDEAPALLAELTSPTGDFFFVGLHPRPPVPGQDTDARDAQIRQAASIADRTVNPVVAMGDFNDVAWSSTSERFKRYGGFKDPRIGRGILPSFDATSFWMRFPIDQFYLTDGFGLVSFDRLAPVGSDHFPMKAVITVQD